MAGMRNLPDRKWKRIATESAKMRLTLRMVLAYLNRVLGPEDTQAIATQIARDEPTQRLVQRIDDVLRHVADQVTLREIADSDPNMVAGYLDNDLSLDETLDFEKTCLESDAELVEVAECHRILVETLGGGAAVPDTKLRQRLCELRSSADRPIPALWLTPTGSSSESVKSSSTNTASAVTVDTAANTAADGGNTGGGEVDAGTGAVGRSEAVTMPWEKIKKTTLKETVATTAPIPGPPVFPAAPPAKSGLMKETAAAGDADPVGKTGDAGNVDMAMEKAAVVGATIPGVVSGMYDRRSSSATWNLSDEDSTVSLPMKILLCLTGLLLLSLGVAGGVAWYRSEQDSHQVAKHSPEPMLNSPVSEANRLQEEKVGGRYFSESADPARFATETEETKTEAPGAETPESTPSGSTGTETSNEAETENAEDTATSEKSRVTERTGNATAVPEWSLPMAPEPKTTMPFGDGTSDTVIHPEPGEFSASSALPEVTRLLGMTDLTTQEEVPFSQDETSPSDSHSPEINEAVSISGLPAETPGVETPEPSKVTDVPEMDMSETEATVNSGRAMRGPNLLIQPEPTPEPTPEPEPASEPRSESVSESEEPNMAIATLTTPTAVVICQEPGADAKSAGVVRLSATRPIMLGDRLVTLPTYRSMVRITDVMTIESAGETAMRMPDYRKASPSSLVLERGFFVLRGGPTAGLSLRCVLGDLPGTLRLADDQTVVAVAVSRELPGGCDPETTLGGFRISLACTEGSAEWTSDPTPDSVVGNAELGTEIGRLRRLRITDDATAPGTGKRHMESAALDEIPTWIEKLPLTPLETNASAMLEREIGAGRNALIDSLNKVARYDSRRETRELARRALRALDVFTFEVHLLGRTEDIDLWDSCFDAIADDMQRSQSTARTIRELFELRAASAGNQVYQLLWKYRGVTELSREQTMDLISKMRYRVGTEMNQMLVRAAAFRMLMQVYPGDTRGYAPGKNESIRERSISRWEQFLKTKLPAEEKNQDVNDHSDDANPV